MHISGERPDLHAGILTLDSLKERITVAANDKQTFSIMNIDVPSAFFHAKAHRFVMSRLPVEDRRGSDVGNIGLLKMGTLRFRNFSLNCLFAGRNNNDFDLCRPTGN